MPVLTGAFRASPKVPEHWTRIKALSRRFAHQWITYYDTLRPLADLIKVTQERVAAFISSPRDWEPSNSSEESREAAVAKVSQEVFSRLHQLAEDRLFRDRVNEWMEAYEHRGVGSTRLRARDIQGIYDVAAAVPSEIPTKESAEFLDRIRELFREAAEAASAKVM
jgi:hypothetical protein